MVQTYRTPTTRAHPEEHLPFAWWVDLIVVLVVALIAYGVVALASRWSGPLMPSVQINLSPLALPGYAGLSTLRMAVAYVIAAVFSIVYARVAVANRHAERIMIPLLDILQSIPILSFMPGLVLGLVALFPGSNLGLEFAAVLLIFSSQAWNLAFGFHQSLVTIPNDLNEAASVYRLNFWDRFTRLELPFGIIPFIWNSMMSWAGGWFFLMASEQFTLGNKDFRLPGLGSYLRTAADAGNIPALFLGLVTLVIVVILLDQLLWRPLVAWSNRFKFEQTGAADAPSSPVLTALRRSALLHWASERMVAPVIARIDRTLHRLFDRQRRREIVKADAFKKSWRAGHWGAWLAWGVVLIAILVLGGLALVGAIGLIRQIGPAEWLLIIASAAATLGRTTLALVLGVAWTVPLGVAIGLNPRLAQRVQPWVQVVASIPATALFPALLLVMLSLPGGLNLAAVALMLLGTQWYILFNVIAGAMAIPTDLREAAAVYKLSGWSYWRLLILPAIFPFLVTGMITASGGAWNASIVAEYVTFGSQTYSTLGLGALIAGAANGANYPLLLAGTLTMAAVVVTVNRLVWRRLYGLAERRYRLD